MMADDPFLSLAESNQQELPSTKRDVWFHAYIDVRGN